MRCPGHSRAVTDSAREWHERLLLAFSHRLACEPRISSGRNDQRSYQACFMQHPSSSKTRTVGCGNRRLGLKAALRRLTNDRNEHFQRRRYLAIAGAANAAMGHKLFSFDIGRDASR